MSERDEARITRLLAATGANADPGVLARAQARLAADEAGPGWLAWLSKPAALVAACALLTLSVGIAALVLSGERTNTDDTTLVASLLGDDGSEGLPVTTAAPGPTAPAVDSGEVTR